MTAETESRYFIFLRFDEGSHGYEIADLETNDYIHTGRGFASPEAAIQDARAWLRENGKDRADEQTIPADFVADARHAGRSGASPSAVHR